MTQQEKNRTVSLHIQRALADHDFESRRDLIDPGFRAYVAGNALGRDEWIGMGKMFMTTFPDGRHEWELAEAAGDYVLLSGFFTGTHSAEFQGIPATGKVVRFSLTIIDRVKDGKLVEHRMNFDSAAMMQQITA